MRKSSTETSSETQWERLRTLSDREIDLSDIPEVDPRDFRKMEVRMPTRKELVSVRIDTDFLDWFRKQGKRYQTRINAVLRAYMESQSR